MGQTLSEPVTAKESSIEESHNYYVACSSMQGWRVSMEDSHTTILSLPTDPDTAFFGVYDGHGGDSVARYAGNNLHRFVLARPEYNTDVEQALKQAFLDIDSEMRTLDAGDGQVGSTAVVVLIKNKRLYCANAGDSRAVACINGVVEPLSFDHKPQTLAESKRITEGGGWVQFNRVNGNLALSRALGDFVYKRNSQKRAEDQIVTAFPDVVVRDVDTTWEFVVIACDGIWDCLSNIEVVDFCRQRLAAGISPKITCEELMDRCLSKDGDVASVGGDNMTVILVCFLHGQPYSEFVKHCKAQPVGMPPQGMQVKNPQSSRFSAAATWAEGGTPIR